MQFFKSFLFTAAATAVVLSFQGCKKDHDEKKLDTKAAEENALAESAFTDLFNQVEAAARNNNELYRSSGIQSNCATITITPQDTTWPKNILIDFGSTNCTGLDGRNRRGQINVHMTGRYRDSATVITVTPSNYHVNDILVEGTKTITNNGRNAAGNLNYGIQVTNAKITNGNKITQWNSSRTREWVAGESTLLNIFDDKYDITGSASGVSSGGSSFQVNITSPLRVQLDCRWITQGQLTMDIGNLPTRYLDYGTGNCDSQATLTINNNTYNIILQ